MIDYAKQKWAEVHTVRDFVSFTEDPNIDTLEFMKTLVDPAKSGFWIAANVDFDIDMDDILAQEPEISHDDITATTRTASEIEHHKKYKFSNGYDRHKATEGLLKIASALGFNDNPSCYINNQRPGTLMHRHIDFVGYYIKENMHNEDFLNSHYDKELRQPKNQKPIYRCFVALDDWKPGQLVNFEPGFWTNWKKGDVLFFDWRNTPHSTANCGVHARPLLKITGTLDDDLYVWQAKEDKTPKQIKL